MADRDWAEKMESVLKGLSVFALPILLGVGGYVANHHLDQQKAALEQEKFDQQARLDAQKQSLEQDKLNQQMLSRAIEVIFSGKQDEQLFGHQVSLESRRLYRAHWLDLYNYFAQVKLAPDFIAIMMELDTRPEGKELVTAKIKEEKAAQNKEKDQLLAPNPDGDGWVAIGSIETNNNNNTNPRLNFELLSKDALNKDRTVKPGTMVRARWSVYLRHNLDNTEDHRPEDERLNPVRGLMGAGECANVLDSRANIRGQTWAKIDVVPCSSARAEAPSAPRS
jgi:hypothetical protein